MLNKIKKFKIKKWFYPYSTYLVFVSSLKLDSNLNKASLKMIENSVHNTQQGQLITMYS